MALGELLPVEACRWRAPTALPKYYVGVDDAQIDVEPQEVAPPLFARPSDLVAFPQLVTQVHPPHVLLVQQQRQRSWYTEREATTIKAVALSLSICVQLLTARTDTHNPGCGVGGEAANHLDIPGHRSNQVTVLALVELPLAQLSHIARTEHRWVTFSPGLSGSTGIQSIPQQSLEEGDRRKEAVHENMVVLTLQTSY